MKNSKLPKDIEDFYPLSDIQKGMVYHAVGDSDQFLYHTQTVYYSKFKGFDENIFKKVWELMAEKHSILRTGFNMYDFEEPIQIVRKKIPLDIEHYDISKMDKKEQDEYLKKLQSKDLQKPFNVTNAEILWRMRTVNLGDDNICFIWSSHHAIIDGWSFASLLTEVGNTYLQLMSNPNYFPGKLKVNYKYFVVDQIVEKKKKENIEFWQTELDGYKRIEFPGSALNSHNPGAKKTMAKKLPGELGKKLTDAAKKFDTSLKHLCFGAYVYMLHMLSHENDVVVGLISNSRPACPDGDKIIGCFLNTLPVRVKIPSSLRWMDYIRLIENKLLGLKKYERLSFLEIVRIIGDVSQNQNPITDTIFNYTDFHIYDRLNTANEPADNPQSDDDLHPEGEMGGTNTLFDCDFSTTGGLFNVVFNFSEYFIGSEMVSTLCGYFEKILYKFVEEPGRIAKKEELISNEEKQRILIDLNNTEAEYPCNKTIIELFEEQVERTSDHIALYNMSGAITYGELDKQSGGLARVLQEKGAAPGIIVGIMMERSIDMIIGIFGVLKAGAAYLPVAPDYPPERIEYMLKDSGAKILLTNSSEGHRFNCQLSIVNCQLSMIGEAQPAARSPQLATSLAYIIYTSGSTGKPKGVLVEHRSLVNIITALQREYPLGKSGVYLLKTSFLFDVSAAELFGWFLGGGKLAILGKNGEKDPQEIMDTIEIAGVTHINFVPSMFNVFVDGLNSQNINKLASLQYIFLAGEALLPEPVNKFRKLNTTIKLENIFGPTEGTIYSSKYSLAQWSGRGSIAIGKPMQNIGLYILDKNNHLQSPGAVGELCISGVGLATGYLNNPELTAAKFINFAHQLHQLRQIKNKSEEDFRHSILYRTGDLARWLPDGNVEFLGRIDRQVKVRGFRIELGEIESQLLRYAGIKEAVVVGKEDGKGDKYLCAYIVSDVEPDMSELRGCLSKELPDYMLPSYFVRLERIPLTPNGKIDLKGLPEPESKSGESYAAPRDEIERKLVKLYSEVLGIEEALISINASFFELGGHSLKVTVLVSKIHKEFHVKLLQAEIFRAPRIRQLGAYIKGMVKDEYVSIGPAEAKEYYALSAAQKRLYIIQQMMVDNTSYNMPYVIPLAEGIDKEKLEPVFKALIARHESLRTSFITFNGEPIQRIHRDVDFSVGCYEIAEKSELNRLIPVLIRAFDLGKAPLLRVNLVTVGSSRGILFIDVHHIITDGISQEILSRDFAAIYGGEKLPPLPIQYKDFSQWQNGEKENERIRQQEAYWLKEFAGEIPVLELPIDYPRPMIQSFEGNSIAFDISAKETRELNALASTGDFTLFMVLTAAFNILLSKLSGQQDIIIGTPVAGRRHADLENIIGMFVNTLVLRNYPEGENTFNGFLNQLKKRTLGAFENQDYQFEDLVENVSVYKDMGRNPLFDVMLVLQNFLRPPAWDPGNEAPDPPDDYEEIYRTAKFDLTLFAMERAGKLEFSFEYCTKLFKRKTIERFIVYFREIFSTIIKEPNIKLSQIEIIPGEEKKQVLYNFNNTKSGYPRDRTIHRLFEVQAEKTPDHIAVLASSVNRSTRQITYRELNKKSGSLSNYLKEKGVIPGNIVGITAFRSLEVIFGILGILKAGGAYLPVEPDFPEDRKNYMLADSGARIVLTARECSVEINDHIPVKPSHADSPHNLAYVVYTSGSTGRPKGVMVEHRNAVRLVINNDYVEFSDLGRVLQTGALSFDASTFEIWGPLLNGAELVLLPKKRILNPEMLKRDIHIFDIATMWMTAPLFNQMMDTDEDIFVGLRNFLVGGDVLSPVHINRLRKKAPGLNIVNGYGPTENTTFSTTFRIGEAVPQNIPIGRPIANSSAYIVDSYNRLQPIGVVGELLVGGDGVSRGYLNSPELTAEKFPPAGAPTHPTHPLPHSPIYRTGDRARWLPDGNVEFLGRTDQQVKIRGFRIELGEIESQLLGYPGIREAVVRSREDSKADKYLCAYIVPDVWPDISGLRDYLSKELPDYMIPSHFVQLEKIPLTPNGKIDLKGLPEPVLEGGDGYVAPRDEIEKKLVGLWSEILGRDARHASQLQTSIGIDDDFFRLGGHSLKATVLVSKIHKEFHVKMPLGEIFRAPSIRELGDYIKGMVTDEHESIGAAEAKEYYALSAAQKRLYILQQMVVDNTGYNMPYVIPLAEGIDKEKLESVFKALIARHESLRTSFITFNQEPIQRIHRDVDFSVGCYEIAEESALNRLIPVLIRAFDLSKAPLLRVNLVTVGSSRGILFIDMHHIITDGISQQILARDFAAIYGGEKLPPLRIQYKDFSQWQNSEKENERIRQQEAYWLKDFPGEIPVLELPFDYPRPKLQSFEGNSIDFDISAGETGALNAAALAEGSTLFMLLLAVFNVLLAKLGGQEDIIVGTPIAGRRHTDLENIIGMFVNTLALRNSPGGELTFREFLQQVRERSLDAFENQDYPFEDLVEKVSATRDASRNPLFDVMIVLQNMKRGTEPAGRPGGTSGDEFVLESQTAKFDLVLNGRESREGLNFSLAYCTTLFKRETIERFITYLKLIFTAVQDDPGVKISRVEILSPGEKRKILYDFNETGVEYPRDRTIQRLFEEQAERIPGNAALVGLGLRGSSAPGPVTITFGELNRLSHLRAEQLRSKGIRPDTIAGIMTERSAAMVVGILAIIKAGGAYLPIAPDYPADRIKFMLEDSGAAICLTTRPHSSKIVFEKDILYLDDDNGPSGIVAPSPCAGSPNDLAYVIYTSGTTGKPKGVMVRHRNVVNLVAGLNHTIYKNYPEGLNISLVSPFIFDASVKQVFVSLLLGHCLHVVPEDIRLDGVLLLDYYKKNRIDISDGTPTHLRVLLESSDENNNGETSSLKHLIIGGEALPVNIMESFFAGFGENAPKVTNIYGPTECTVDSTLHEVTLENMKGSRIIPIGKPMPNCGVMIVNRGNYIQPIGIPGEICIGGHGVAAGYLNNPELTNSKFQARRSIARPLRIPNSLLSFSLYRTGDLGRWLPGGDIEFLGRMDSQVKIRGFRIEPGEIENRLSRHPAIKEAVVLARETAEGSHKDKYLCAYMVTAFQGESPSTVTPPKIREFLSRELPDYMLPSHFVTIDKIPLTPGGKVDRKALPLPEIEITGEYAPPRDSIEKHLVHIWAEVLGIDEENIGIKNNFFQLGGHSLKAVVMIAKVHKQLNMRLPLAEVFKTPTVKGLAQFMKKGSEETFRVIEPAEKKEYYGLSSAQKRLYLIRQMVPEDTVYNMPKIVPLQEAPDTALLEKAFKQLIRRHESLRTSFHLVDDRPVQKIHDDVAFSMEHGAWSMEGGDFVRPFDLSRAPLLRAGLIKAGEEKYVLLVDMHHIISDGISTGILTGDFISLYRGETLPPLRLQYKDYSQWQNSDKEREVIKRQEEYWLREFEGEPPVINMPTDFPRPVIQSFEGTGTGFEVGTDETKALKKIALETGATLYMALLAVYNIFLSKVSGQEDIVVGTPVAGRRHADMEKIIGMFVNTLALRNYPHGEKPFTNFLSNVKERTVEAFENQEYPFEDLVEKAPVNRETSRNPLFDVMFAFQDIGGKGPGLPGEEDTPGIRTAKFDFTLIGSETAAGESLVFIVEYCTKLFKKSTIHRFIAYFKKIISLVVKEPGIPLGQVEIVSQEEKQQILQDFNNAGQEYPTNKSIHQLFAEQAGRTPDAAAVNATHRAHRTYITYKELQQKSNQLAHVLREKSVQPGTFVAIKTERSLEMIVGILGVLEAGGAYVPLNPKAPEARIKYILRECSVKILLSNVVNVSEDIEVIDLNETLFMHPTHPTQLCYVIFTSGSTGNPKGVPITHSNLSPLLHWGYELGLGVGDRTLQNLAYYFDWSVWEIFITLTSGACLHVVPDEVLLNPGACIDFMSKHRVTVLHVTPTQYRYFARTKQKTGTLKYLFIGAEKLDADLVRRSFELVRPDCRVFNMYGPTEATIISAVLEIERTGFEESESLSGVPIGGTMANARLLVLDRYLKLCPVNIGGELYIAGDGLAAGYLNDPEKTCKSFIKNIYETRGIKGKWLYRTGDLVRWLSDGNIEFFGRIDHQVKIRGHRIELGEIEKHLLQHPNVKEAVVIALELGKEMSDKYLCAYFVPQPAGAAAELKEYLADSLPDYMIPSYFTPIEKIPLTPNGKIDRKALPVPEIGPTEAYAAPGNEVEKVLAQLWAEVLNIRAPIGIDDNFFDLGGHSLKATGLVSRIHKTLDVKLPLTLIFTSPTIRELAEHITAAARDSYISIESVEKKDYYVLSPAQKRLYILYRMVPLTTSYNMPEIIPLDGEPDIKKLEQTFKKLIAHHESLRTSFHMINEHPVQRIHHHVEFKIEYYDAEKNQFVRPFDLSRPPLLRVGLVKVKENQTLLMMDMHHIISDGLSRGILERDFAAFYRGEAVPPLTLQYKDYAQWQMDEKNRAALKQQEAYWLEIFAGEIPVLDIATDYARPAVQRFEGDTIRVNLGTAGTGKLNKLALEQGATMFMVLTAVTNILLAKLSSQEDIIIGTPIAGRRHADLEKIIGMFVNTIALRSYPMGEKSFAAFLEEVKVKTLEAFENQEYPFEELVERAAVKRDTGRNPLFDVMLAFQNLGDTTAGPGTKDTGDTQDTPMPTPDRFESSIAKFDLTLIAGESEQDLYISFNYSTSLFKKETIQRFIFYFKKIISIVAEEPGKKLSEIEMLTGEEKKRLLYDFNRRESDYPRKRTIRHLFKTQAEKTPESIALNDMVPGERRPALTYRELNEKTNQLARVLKEKGITAGAVAGIMTDRSTAMIVGIISILKAGGAYLPLNPQNPTKRTEYMLEDCEVELFLTHKKYGEPFREKYHIIDLEDQALYEYHDGDKEVIKSEHAFNHLAYVIYTSGSTGNPKGVPISHFNLSPLLHWGYRHLGINSTDRVLQNLSYFFDWSVWEIFIALTTGAGLYIAPGSLLLNPEAQVDFINGNGITVLHITPTHFRYLANLEPGPKLETLKYLFIGAEKLGYELVQQGMEMVNEDCRVYNMYGPTEATIISNVLEIDKTDEGKYKELSSIPIGKPVGNTDLLVLDKNMKMCPIHAAGELYIGGDGVAQGYLNNPELTIEKFFSSSLPRFPLYRTGDLVRWLPDGNMEFLNRIDYQVKIRGYRIELAEIENQLARHPGTAGVVVIDRESTSGEKSLCAYIIPSPTISSQPVNALDPSELKKYLSRLLPDYMIPSSFVTIEKMPLNPNGKIDRRALPEPQIAAGEEVVGPGDEIEEALVNIWSDVLGESRDAIEIGIHDDFFERGGHSLRATLLVSKIQKELAVTFPLVEIFQRPTVREQAEYIRYMKDSGEEIAPLAGIEDENLVLLTEKTTKANHLFFVHDGSGEVEGYIEFCRRLTGKFNYWGIRADRWESTPPQNLTIEELAGKYIEKIKKVQAQGPYHICGWSIGGTIAFEMVRQLEQDRQEIGFFALFDTAPPRTSLKREKPADINQISPEGMARIIPNYHRLGKKELMVYLDRIRTLDQARKNYIPGGKLITAVHFFAARQSPLSKVSIKKGWSGYSEKPLNIHKISGDHFSIFRMPGVRAFAETFDSILDKHGK